MPEAGLGERDLAVDATQESGAGSESLVVIPEQRGAGAGAVAKGLRQAVAVERFGPGFGTFGATEQGSGLGVVNLPDEAATAEARTESIGLGGRIQDVKSQLGVGQMQHGHFCRVTWMVVLRPSTMSAKLLNGRGAMVIALPGSS